MIKRLAKVLLFIPAMCVFPFELLFCSIRWVLTGKNFYESPLYWYILFEW